MLRRPRVCHAARVVLQPACRLWSPYRADGALADARGVLGWAIRIKPAKIDGCSIDGSTVESSEQQATRPGKSFMDDAKASNPQCIHGNTVESSEQ
ncbi:hypothetical protein DCS_03333 [Drechmeria coniospora]|uniref:Uncharacterized protein n=1 Tax=Drechmeria coniospora TaxID=98403 RepID=A0A151GGW8_DRECN|nr:hypothetical protein DCS_03333 [Drechmeria coniospora]KYK56335.1 hypothetical protein DCS_03333 [Drechmeria coniospora]